MANKNLLKKMLTFDRHERSEMKEVVLTMKSLGQIEKVPKQMKISSVPMKNKSQHAPEESIAELISEGPNNFSAVLLEILGKIGEFKYKNL